MGNYESKQQAQNSKQRSAGMFVREEDKSRYLLNTTRKYFRSLSERLVFPLRIYILTKLRENMRRINTGTGTPLGRVLEDLRKKQTKPKCVLQVDRKNLFRSGMAYFKVHESELSPMGVVMETDGMKETELDLGGPLREFFTLFFQQILRKEVDMFEGQDQGRMLIPVNNEAAIESEWFRYLGRAVVISLISGGPGFPFLAPYVVSYIRKREYMHELNVGVIHNVFLRQYIKRLNEADTDDQLMKVIGDDTETFIDQCGWPRTKMITIENRLLLTQTLLRWELVSKRMEALEQLQDGLNTLGFLDKTSDITEADDFLIHRNTEKATAEYLKKCLRDILGNMTASNDKEENAKEFTLKCMEMLTDAEATSLFHFITGMSALPVSDIPIEVEYNRSNKEARLPEAVTCIQRLRIPLGNESQMEFYSSFHKALSMGRYGFHANEHV